jgi:hypothetical protein
MFVSFWSKRTPLRGWLNMCFDAEHYQLRKNSSSSSYLERPTCTPENSQLG